MAAERFEADIADLLRQIPTAPKVVLGRVREVLPDLDLGYQKLLHQWLMVPFAVAVEARKNPDLIAPIHTMMPKRRKRYDPKDILRHSLQIAGKAFDTGKTPYSLACERERALRRFIEQGVEPRELPRLIEEAGGIGTLDDDQREQAKAAEVGEMLGRGTGASRKVRNGRDGDEAPGTSTRARRGASEERVTEPTDHTEADGSERDGLPTSRKAHAPTRSGRCDFDRKTDLAVTMTEEILDEVLSLPPGTCVTIHAVVGALRGGWKVLQAEEYEIEGGSPRRATADFGDERGPALHRQSQH